MTGKLVPASLLIEDARAAYLARYYGLIPEDFRERVADAYGRACACCGSSLFLTIDHIVPRSATGEPGQKRLWEFLWRHDFPKSDYQLLCRLCNGLKAHGVECGHRSLARHLLKLMKESES